MGENAPHSSIRTIAVIGAGTAGRSFAVACARAGFHVILEDVMPANLRRAQDEFSSASGPGAHLDSEMWEKDHGCTSRRDVGSGSLTTALTVEDAVRSADLAIDFVPDELESKLEIFSMLDRMAPPRTILLTPSDAQSITDLASCTYRPTRCFALRHFAFAGNAASPSALRAALLAHPPHADSAALSATAAFLRALGCTFSIEPDTAVPVLMKNQPRA